MSLHTLTLVFCCRFYQLYITYEVRMHMRRGCMQSFSFHIVSAKMCLLLNLPLLLCSYSRHLPASHVLLTRSPLSCSCAIRTLFSLMPLHCICDICCMHHIMHVATRSYLTLATTTYSHLHHLIQECMTVAQHAFHATLLLSAQSNRFMQGALLRGDHVLRVSHENGASQA